MTKWPIKKHYTQWEENTPDGQLRKGFNLCHDAFMKVINEKEKERKEIKELWDKCTEEK